MPTITLPEINLSEIGERIQGAADESRLPDEVRERIDDAAEVIAEAGKDLSEAASRLGSEVGERLADVRWPALAGLSAAFRSMPTIRAVKVDLPEVTVGRRSSGPPLLPIVLVAAVGALFVGWWFATSSYAPARVKSAVRQVRTRIGRAQEDENVEERTEDFWSNERGWEPTQSPDVVALRGDDGGIVGISSGSVSSTEDMSETAR